jgi:pimeloyl-ACP methyl ester carboxylesterase
VPAVLLLHAGVADRTMWDDHLEPFAAAGYRVVAPDLVTGDAPWADVVETLDALGIDRAAWSATRSARRWRCSWRPSRPSG